jgi:hypothetical protein
MKLSMMRESIGTTTACIATGVMPGFFQKKKKKKKRKAISEAENGANRATGYLGISGQSQPTNSMTTVWTAFKSPPVNKTFEKKYAMKLPNPDERLLKQHRGKGY